MTKITKISAFLLILAFAFSLSVSALAQAPADSSADPFGIGIVANETGLGGGGKDLREVIGSIIKVALSFLGVVAIVIVLIGGFKYMTAGGSQEKVDEARKYIMYGIIGLAIILAAYAITSFVLSSLQTAIKD